MRRPAILSLLLLLAVTMGVALWWTQGPAAPSPLPAEAAGADQDEARTGAGVGERVEVDAGQPPAPAASDQARRDLLGTVLGSDGRPLAGAEVVLQVARGAWPALQPERITYVYSGGDGSFEFRSVPEGQLVLLANHKDHAREQELVPADVDRAVIELEQGYVVQGIVVDPAGHPVAEAVVVLESRGFRRESARSQAVDRDGRFVFRNVPAGFSGAVDIGVRHPSLAPMQMPSVPVAGGEELRLVMSGEPGQVLLGRAMDLDGEPVVDAEVRVYPAVTWDARLNDPYVTRTDEQGNLRLAGLPNSNVTAEISHPGYSSVRRVLSLRRDHVEEFELVGRVRIRGSAWSSVRDDLSGLELELTDRFGLRLRARLAADGSFDFAETISEGPAELEVVGGELAFADSTGRRTSVYIEDREETRLELELVPASMVIGRLVNGGGEPLAGASVSAPRYALQRLNPERWVTITDLEGRFVLRGLPVGEHRVWCTAHGVGHRLVVVKVPAVGGAEAVGDVVLEEFGRMRGTVWRAGSPLAGASIVATSENVGARAAISDAAGRFEISGLTPGDYRVFARWSTLPIRPAPGAVTVRSGRVTDGLRFEFLSGRELTGQVVDERGEAVSRAAVFVAGAPSPPARTDERGRFVMRVPVGDIALEVLLEQQQSRGPDYHRVSVDAAQTEVTVTVPYVARSELRAKVVGMPGDRPLRSVILHVEPQPADAESDEQTARRRVRSVLQETRGGQLSWGGLPAGPALLTIDAPGFAPFSANIDAPQDGFVDLGNVRLEPGGRLQGLVVTAAGDPVGGAIVHMGTATDLEHEELHRNLSAADGSFVVDGVAPGSRRLIVFKPGNMAREIDLDFPAVLLSGRPLRVTLAPEATLTVQVVRDGQPLATPKLVTLEKDGRRVLLQLTDNDGSLEMRVNQSGRFRVFAFGFRELGQWVEIPADGGEVRVDVPIE